MTTNTAIDPAQDGLILAPVGPDGPWAAVRALREGVRGMSAGRCASATFVTAITQEGRRAHRSSDVALLALGIRWDL